MQILAALISFAVIYGLFKLATWLWNFFMEKAKDQMMDFKHRKNGQDKKH
jgi:hypothetical protein